MKILLFTERNLKEIIRDPVNLFFALVFPLILLALFSVINSAIPADAGNTMYEIGNIAPGIATFGLVFMCLFSGMLISKDRETSFLTRLFTSPMTPFDFIAGYTLPVIVLSVVQSVITFIVSLFLGLHFTAGILLAVALAIPLSILYVGLGLLLGSFLNDKAVGGICGGMITNIAGWLSGVWIPLDLIGGAFKTTAEIFPFYHSVEAAKAAIGGNYGAILPHLAVVLGYAAVIYALAVVVFRYKMTGDKT